MTEDIWEKMRNNGKGYFALSPDEKACLKEANSRKAVECRVCYAWERWTGDLDIGTGDDNVFRIAPDIPFPIEEKAKNKLSVSWTFVGYGRNPNLLREKSFNIARFSPLSEVWETGQRGSDTDRVYAVRNNSDDSIWRRFGIPKNPNIPDFKESEFEVLDVVAHGPTYYTVDSEGRIKCALLPSIVGLHSIRYEDKNGEDCGWKFVLPPVHYAKDLLIPKQVKVRRTYQ